MTPPANSGQQLGKKDRREQARETARIEREAMKRRERRNTIFLQGGIGVAVLAIIAVIALVIVNVNSSSTTSTTAGPKNMVSDGIVLSGSNLDAVTTAAIKKGGNPVATAKKPGVTAIVTYIDYQCPYCQQFESTNENQIATMVSSGKATLEIHPIAFLDGSSGSNKYSTRAANAAACVANYDPNKFFAVNAAFYSDQPAENSNGRTDDQILATLKKGGANSSAITSCVKSQTFAPWVKSSTARIDPTGNTVTFKGVATTPQKFAGTPTVFVNGERYSGSLTDAAAFASFVQAHS